VDFQEFKFEIATYDSEASPENGDPIVSLAPAEVGMRFWEIEGLIFLFAIVRVSKHYGTLASLVWQRANPRSAVTAQANRVRSRWRKPLFTRIHD
jgi:hypothetical protein